MCLGRLQYLAHPADCRVLVRDRFVDVIWVVGLSVAEHVVLASLLGVLLAVVLKVIMAERWYALFRQEIGNIMTCVSNK